MTNRESGKSTVMKQLTVLYQNGFSQSERQSYREICYSNTVQSLQAILEALPMLGLNLHNSSYDAASLVEDLDPQERGSDSDGEVKQAMTVLLRDPAIKAALNQRAEFQLNDSAVYFFKALDRVMDRNFIPTDDDM